MSTRAKQVWPADKVERRDVSELIPYARNARIHSEAQVAQIAASIKEWGWTTPVLIDENGGIIAGHGRVLAARKLKLDQVPVMTAAGWSEAQKRAYVLADNQLALNAGWDVDLLKVEIGELQTSGFDTALIGFDPIFIEGMLASYEELGALEEGLMDGTGNEPLAERTIHVHFHDSGNAHLFAQKLNVKITDKTKSIWFDDENGNGPLA